MVIESGPVHSFAIGDGYGVYRGPTADSAFHRHAAFQIAVAERGEITMMAPTGTRHHGEALLVAPMMRHRLLATEDLHTFYVEPQCVSADRLRALVEQAARSGRGGSGIIAAPELSGFRASDLAGPSPSGELDPRLVTALNLLRDGTVTLPELPALVGLSPQRLRALAREQVGMPLARWRIWAQLRRATEALGAGESLAAAAITAGFADQAHFTRRMREMMGLTPAVVLAALSDQSRCAT
ncbi:helix-turn-helix domain-containing protein [Nocardia aurantia]|uniref:helix-turn-helix domain-containing protein n=1 Tax=Nocardia aurantia TaxID=2585199 RepID=UPI0029E7E062|nr:helix-turn-helix domain-containing protein [Nocardia aurantia]